MPSSDLASESLQIKSESNGVYLPIITFDKRFSRKREMFMKKEFKV